MKTRYKFSPYISVVFLALVLFASSFDAAAQNRRNNKKDHDNDRKEYRQPERNNGHQGKNEWKNKKDGHRDDRNYESRNNQDGHHSKYSKKSYYAHRNSYDHPKYGRVYNRFDRNPIVYKHSRGNYYYSGNHFYRYQRGVGYYVVEAPRNQYFSHLPDDCRRVQVNGNVFFRNGDVFFQHSRRGYAIVPSPVGINISLGF